MMRASFRFTISKIRQKISFMAFAKKQTITELFITAIISSYNDISIQKQMRPGIPADVQQDLENILQGQISNVFKFMMRMKINYGKINSTNLSHKLYLERQKEQQLMRDTKIHVKKKTQESFKVKTINKYYLVNQEHKIKKMFEKKKCFDIF